MKINVKKGVVLSSKWIVIFLMLVSCSLRSQEISRTVIGNAGDYYEHNLFGNIHWTVGEIAVTRFQNGLELDEGFHRLYYDLVVKNYEPLPEEWEVNLYPNPTPDRLNINVPQGENVTVQLFSATGQLLQTIKDFDTETTVQMNELPAGVYWLRLFDQDGRQGSFQVQKITQ